jgi:hypothetical protein
LVERSQEVRKSFARSSVEEPDHRLLRVRRRERPCGRCAAKQCDELASPQFPKTSLGRPGPDSDSLVL